MCLVFLIIAKSDMELLYLNDINTARLTVENLYDVFIHIFELECCTFYNKNVLA